MGKQIKRIRVRFQYADEDYLYVNHSESADGELVRVRYNVPHVNEEFAQTCELLWRNAQLNLLDVHLDEENVLTPEIIVLEPDYLIDISSLAECFRDYGHHPANYQLARLQTAENTMPLLLGNIANLFLDEWIHAEEEPDYLTCMKKVFRTYALELAACPDLRNVEKERDFFAQCKMHFHHIRQTIKNLFQSPGYELEKRDALLEPSYICEPLGLQGRLDYMQRDMSSFIEMKSGKADEFSMRGKMLPKENNMVQMLLYQAVLEYSMGKRHEDVKSYLFYTRYPLLYPIRASWSQVRKVIDVRNRIVEKEFALQLRNNLSYTEECLKTINPETLNERNLSNVLWQRYLAPQINAVAESMRKLSELEKKYFLSNYNFITKELYTSKSSGLDEYGRAGAAALWLASLEKKCEAGEILFDLKLTENNAADMHHPHLKFTRRAFEEQEELPVFPNFRDGDAVVIYERQSDEDNVTNKLVFKGNIERLTSDDVVVRLRASQQNKRVLPETTLYAIEHDCMDTSFRAMYQGLATFLSANQHRRDLLLGQALPEVEKPLDGNDLQCDDFQRIAKKALVAKDYFILVGPPGTGKTSRALRAMVESFYAEKKQVLLLAYTNRAVDEICKALVRIEPRIDFIRMGSELACDEVYRSYLLENVLDSCVNRREVQERMAQCRVYVGTVSTLSLKPELFRLKTFDVAIIDEASQILEPQLLGLLCAKNASGADAIGKWVMIGDHKQLPAVVVQTEEDSKVCDEDLNEIGLMNMRDSLFERLYRMNKHNPSCVDMLCKQGRMNVEVADFPNKAFYGGNLEIVGLPHQQGELPFVFDNEEFADVLNRRVAFIPSQKETVLKSTKVNQSEAQIVAKLAASVYRQYQSAFHPDVTLGIIAPYRNQIALIKRELAKMGIEALNRVLVDTVERFQGSERDIIIYSFCVNVPQQLAFLSNLTEDEGVMIDRKLNVALTRARKQMFLTGVEELLVMNPIYARLLVSAKYN